MRITTTELKTEIKSLLSEKSVKDFIKYYIHLVETDDRNKIVILAYILNSLVDKPEVRAALNDLKMDVNQNVLEV